MHTNKNTNKHTHKHTRTYVRMHAHSHAHTHTDTHTHTRIFSLPPHILKEGQVRDDTCTKFEIHCASAMFDTAKTHTYVEEMPTPVNR